MQTRFHFHHPAAYVLLYDQDKLLLLLREHTNWRDGEYGLPAGKVKRGEPFTTAACREAKEEIGVVITPAQLKPVHFSVRYDKGDDAAWDDMYFLALGWEGEPFNAEPHKHGEAKWFDAKALPDKLMEYQAEAIDHIQKGNMYSEHGW